MPEPRRAPPKPGTPEYAKALKLAQEIEKMASEPVDSLVRSMRLLKMPGQVQRIVLEAMARKALKEAANALGA